MSKKSWTEMTEEEWSKERKRIQEIQAKHFRDEQTQSK